MDVGKIVGRELGRDGGQVNLRRLRKVESSLDTRVENDTIEVWMRFGDAGIGC